MIKCPYCKSNFKYKSQYEIHTNTKKHLKNFEKMKEKTLNYEEQKVNNMSEKSDIIIDTDKFKKNTENNNKYIVMNESDTDSELSDSDISDTDSDIDSDLDFEINLERIILSIANKNKSKGFISDSDFKKFLIEKETKNFNLDDIHEYVIKLLAKKYNMDTEFKNNIFGKYLLDKINNQANTITKLEAKIKILENNITK